MSFTVEIEGLEEVVRRLTPGEWLGARLRFWQRVGETVSNEARIRAPTGVSGRLKTGYFYEAEADGWSCQVGNRVEYAPYIEYGTGRLGDPEAPYAHKAEHWPPGAALDVWAARHGLASGYAVAKAIGRRGGLEPRRVLRNAIKYMTDSSLNSFGEQMLNEIAEGKG